MFQPHTLNVRPQKQRHCRGGSVRLFTPWLSSTFRTWPRVLALGPGNLASTLVERLVILSKRSLASIETSRKFWVNLQVASVLTRKPENVRMGKGKGGRKAVQAHVGAGVTLVGFSALRPGLLTSLERRIRVRCGFPVRSQTDISAWTGCQDDGFVGCVAGWRQLSCLQLHYLSDRYVQFREELQQMRRPILWHYVFNLFLWRFIVPHATWIPPVGYRRKFRVRRRRAYRVRLLGRSRPQGLGFLRQIRMQIRKYWWRLQFFQSKVWRRCHKRWQVGVWSSRLFRKTSNLPWSILLRARKDRRLLPYLYYGSVYGADLASPTWGVDVVGRVVGMTGLGERENNEVRMRGAVWLQPLLLAQAVTVLLHWRWLVLVQHPLSYVWIDDKAVIFK